MAVVHTECLCPSDSKPQALAKINNNLSSLFFLMSLGLFRGNTVNLGACLCSEPQILATINNNIAAFYTWFANSGGVPVDSTVTTLAQLAAIPTISLSVPVVKIWILEADGTFQVWRLLASTAATVSGAIQRPDDYDGTTNAKVWFKASS